MSRLYIATLFNFCAEYIMQDAGLEEAQGGMKIAGRNRGLLSPDGGPEHVLAGGGPSVCEFQV